MSKVYLPDDLTDGRSTLVAYQVYQSTFADSNGDGIGDLPGITKKIGYIAHLGVDAIMLGPIHPTPADPEKSDGGYAVNSHRRIDPKYGTMEDFDQLVGAARKKGMGIIMDPVVCHTSSYHNWFEKSRHKKEPYTDYYVWHPGVVHETGEKWTPESTGKRVEPNNWLSCFGGSAWELDPVRNEFYLHHFAKSQPALNLGKRKVQGALFGELKFWRDRYADSADSNDHKTGVIGMRVDAAPFAVSDPKLRHDDWLYGWPNNKALESWNAQYHNHSICQTEAADVYRNMRKALGKEFFLLGEVIAGPEGGRNGLSVAATYRDSMTSSYTDLSTPYVFDNAWVLRDKAATNKRLFPGDEICTATSTHDIPRLVSRLEGLPGDGRLRDIALRQEMMRLLCEPGDKILYNGDELGLPQANVPHEHRKDKLPNGDCRDGSRTPVPWVHHEWRQNGMNGGFTSSSTPWLPLAQEHRALSAAAQEHCKHSFLHFTGDFIRWRREQPALVKGQTFYLDNDGDVYGMVRASKDQTMLLLFNRSDREASINIHDHLSEVLIEKLGLQLTPIIRLAPYGTDMTDSRTDRHEMRAELSSLVKVEAAPIKHPRTSTRPRDFRHCDRHIHTRHAVIA